MACDINVFREEYKKQKKLEEIVNSRTLVRPNVQKWQVTASFVILPFLLFGAIYFSIVLEWSIPYKILFLLICIFFIVELYLRFCLLLVVKCYQNLAKTKTRRRCKCIPSCSEYAVICIKRVFPLLLALLKIRKRLYHTCNGEEYKIDFPFRKMGEEFESRL